jgi:GT2 family glycosyltransferase
VSLPVVHIVILNWNGLADTLECLASVRKLTYPNVRVQVVDNASANNEAEIIEKRFPEVNLLKQKENLGFCGGCNAGMKQALAEGADFVMLLNNDALVSPGLIEALLEGYERLENPGAVSPVIFKHPETEKIWFSVAEWEAVWKTGEAKFRLALDEDYDSLKNRKPYETEFACGCCLFVSSRVIGEVGLFDERYFAFFDEAEWCVRMKKHGLTSYVIPSAFMYHKVGGSTPSLVSTYLLTRNRLLWMKENLSFGRKLKSYPVMAKEFFWHLLNAGNFVSEGKRYVPRERSRAFLQGCKDYFLRRFGKWGEETEKVIFKK